tara:strand:- start:15503 stop:16675 length:1173 start_codon:yes stop_codon:yes gene_type:complete
VRVANRIKNLGTESAFNVLARANELEKQGRSIINLGIGQPDFRTPDNVVEAAKKALIDGHHGYTPANGIIELREAVSADILLRRKAKINPDNIMILPGGKVTIFFSALIFGQPGNEIIYPDPGFPIYKSAIEFSGSKPVPFRVDENNNFSFKADDILDKITHSTSLIIINSPGNPTGGVVSQQEVDSLVKGLEDFPNVFVLSDEIYSRITYGSAKHYSLLQYPSIRNRLILLDGWSKTYAMTGWRIGYSVWPKKLIETVTRLSINNHSCVNAMTQFAALEALNGPQDSVDHMIKSFEERRKIIVEALSSIKEFKCSNPEGAFYVMPDISATGKKSKDLQDNLLENVGVATISGTSFGDFGEGFLRFSYATSKENILEAVNRIKQYLDSVI